MTQPAGLEKARRIGEAAVARKAEDVVILDVRELSSVADTFVLATGTSDRHVRSIVDGIIEVARSAGERPLGVEGHAEGRWVLVDLNDVIVHVFLPETREHYDLDRLWSDAPQIELESAPARSAGR